MTPVGGITSSNLRDYVIAGKVTGRWRFKGPGHITRMYGAGLREHALIHSGNVRDYMPHGTARWYFGDKVKIMDYADVEARLLNNEHSTYSGHDPRNHFGKFATRRNIK